MSEEASCTSCKTEDSIQPKTHSLDAHLVTSVIRDTIAAPNIDNIIEEEEEEEDESQTQSKSRPTENTSKFTLETVVLDNLSNLSTAQEPPPPPSLEVLESSGVQNENENENENENDYQEVVEIKVEEGYATRQMDEYFRQTIAAIKEELTKKLETKNDVNHLHHGSKPHRHHDIDEYDSNDEFEERYLNDENEQETLRYDDLENSINKTSYDCACANCCDTSMMCHCRNNRNLLYQRLLSLTRKKPSKIDNIASWLVLFGCVLNLFIIDGLCLNYANLFYFIQKEFKDSSKLITSMPGTLLIAFYLLNAPISLFLTKQYGTRRIALIGSFISTVSLLISSFLLTNIVAFTIFYGVFTGIGISLIYIPSLIALSQWFLKKRLFANSLAVLGACLGAALYPLISDCILNKYGLHGTLLILSGVQFNCLVGSMLLREHKTAFSLSFRRRLSRKKNQQQQHHQHKFTNKKKSPSSALLIEHDKNELNESNTTEPKRQLLPKINHLNRHRMLSGDSETESTTSVSTSTNTKYTLKQYWRKFVQTRKTPANTKKNLFHLIAEEKRKTRTLSKTSLEDGFVITTSNNLLAPNDESHVIVSRNAKIAPSTTSQTGSSSRAASRFFTRIANSLRSLTHTSNPLAHSPINSSIHSKINMPAALNNATPSANVNIHEINEASKANKILDAASTPAPLIPLMSVFNGPMTDQSEQQQEYVNMNVGEDAQSCNSDSDEDSTPPSNYFTSNQNKVNTGLKNSRYLSYRNSLTNSMRGSLMECSVPEDREEEETEINSGGDGNSSVNDDEDCCNQADKNAINRRLSQRHVKRRPHFNSQRSASFRCKSNNNYSKMDSNATPLNSSVSHPCDNNNKIQNGNLNKAMEMTCPLETSTHGVGYVMPSFLNIRRFISTIEGSSFYNIPVNLETVEYNLRNSLIKKCSDFYRKQQKLNRSCSESSRSTLFLDYLAYLTSFKLFENKILFLINVSFLLNMVGLCIVLVFISEYSIKVNVNVSRTQSIYVLCLIGLTMGFGRVISTISYKVNESNAKSRLFAYVLTLLLIGTCVFVATILCDTLFSFSMFAITFGILMGFNLNLRSLFIYDLIGLEWSDDSLFCYGVLFQSIGVCVGLPLAGLMYDMLGEHRYLFYFSGSCFILSGLILTPGRKLRSYCKSSFKSLNKFYLHRRI